jgi:hypothetical protein
MNDINPAEEVLKAISVAFMDGSNVVEIPSFLATPSLVKTLGLQHTLNKMEGKIGPLKIVTTPNVRLSRDEEMATLAKGDK